jgi:energy-coupling factor transporter ATP-binding protein EcfA2
MRIMPAVSVIHRAPFFCRFIRSTLADEPAADLDRRTGTAIIALMRQQSAHHVLFVFSSHNPQVLAEADDAVNLTERTQHLSFAGIWAGRHRIPLAPSKQRDLHDGRQTDCKA